MTVPEQVKQIQNFIVHLDKNVNDLMDDLSNAQGYQDKYDLHITLNGNSLTTPLHADIYCRLTDLLAAEIAELVDLKSHLKRIHPLAYYQHNIYMETGKPEHWMITFTHAMQTITTPFLSVHNPMGSRNPAEYYNKSFFMSDWFNEDKIKALEERVKIAKCTHKNDDGTWAVDIVDGEYEQCQKCGLMGK